MSAQGEIVQVEGRELRLTNLDKVMFPKTGFTKAQVIDYYARIAPWLLPHLKGRALTLKRYPNGVEAPHFYEKRCPAHRPEWVKTATIAHAGKAVPYCTVEEAPTLVWLANLADLELHTSLAIAGKWEQPTVLAFDLDPGPPAGIVLCSTIALLLRGMFRSLGLECFPKTSGSKGMQVYVPLNTPVTYDDTKPFAKSVAELLERENPKLVTSLMRKDLRPGKVFIDWSQNDDFKTTVCVYSLRAMERPTVSTPLEWKEVERCSRTKEPLAFETHEVLERCRKKGDLFEPVLALRQRLPRLG